jgi:hypothetical protein
MTSSSICRRFLELPVLAPFRDAHPSPKARHRRPIQRCRTQRTSPLARRGLWEILVRIPDHPNPQISSAFSLRRLPLRAMKEFRFFAVHDGCPAADSSIRELIGGSPLQHRLRPGGRIHCRPSSASILRLSGCSPVRASSPVVHTIPRAQSRV